MFRPLLFLALLLCAAPAAADVTGRYRNGDKTMTIEISDAGLVRFGQDDGESYTVFNGDEAFVVSNEGGNHMVMRWADMVSVLDEEIARLFEGVPPPAQDVETAPGEWQSVGPATVEGQAGVEYRFPGETMQTGERIVLSDDARLAPLGLAWSRAFAMMPSFGGLFGRTGTRATRQLSALLATRGPLQLGAIRLIEVHFEMVDPGRFTLPGEPMSRDEVAAQLFERMHPNLAETPQ